jgi:hypothetical protein
MLWLYPCWKLKKQIQLKISQSNQVKEWIQFKVADIYDINYQ